MITLILTLIFLGSYCLYNTSKNTILNNSYIENWLQKNNIVSKSIGTSFYLIGLIISILTFGITSGILYWLLLIIIILSLSIIILPILKNKL